MTQHSEQLTRDGELMAYKHFGFWHPMDTVRDRNTLNELCISDTPPWLDFSPEAQGKDESRKVLAI